MTELSHIPMRFLELSMYPEYKEMKKAYLFDQNDETQFFLFKSESE